MTAEKQQQTCTSSNDGMRHCKLLFFASRTKSPLSSYAKQETLFICIFLLYSVIISITVHCVSICNHVTLFYIMGSIAMASAASLSCFALYMFSPKSWFKRCSKVGIPIKCSSLTNPHKHDKLHLLRYRHTCRCRSGCLVCLFFTTNQQYYP